MKDKFSDEDKSVLTSLVEETLKWVEAGDYTKEEYDTKQKEVETVYFPIIQKAYGVNGTGGMPGGLDPSMFAGGMPDAAPSNSEPNIEELD
jgi:L1 cell adhesion molecule like protein